MKVRVLFFAEARAVVGLSEKSLVLQEGNSVSELTAALVRLHPALEAVMKTAMVAVNQITSQTRLDHPHQTEGCLDFRLQRWSVTRNADRLNPKFDRVGWEPLAGEGSTADATERRGPDAVSWNTYHPVACIFIT
eukprot:RCo047347